MANRDACDHVHASHLLALLCCSLFICLLYCYFKHFYCFHVVLLKCWCLNVCTLNQTFHSVLHASDNIHCKTILGQQKKIQL
jgi:hypothetical protein